MTGTRAPLVASIVLVTFVATPLSALAQNADNKVQAEALFEEGRRLMDAKKFADACPKLEASEKLDPGAGTLLNLAACYEANGQLASAWVTYKDAAAAAQGRHPDWADQANAKADELKPKLSHLTVIVTESVPGLTVKRDGNVISESVLGAAMPVDPGSHTIDASAPGHTPFSTKVVVPSSNGAITVTIPALAAEQKGAPPPTDSNVGHTQRLLGAAVTGVGVVGIGVGAVFGILALGKKSSASDPTKCNSDLTVCNKDGKDLVDAAKSDGFVSTVTLIGGAAFTAAGVVLYLTAPHAEKQPEPATLRASLGAPGAAAGFSLGGTF